MLVRRIYAIFEMLTRFQLDFLVEREKCFKKCRLGRKNRRRYSRYFICYILIFLPSSKLKSKLKYFNSEICTLDLSALIKVCCVRIKHVRIHPTGDSHFTSLVSPATSEPLRQDLWMARSRPYQN